MPLRRASSKAPFPFNPIDTVAMKHSVIIETHRMSDDTYRAYVTKGPQSAVGYWCNGRHRAATYQAAAAGMREQYPTLDLSFLHAET